MRNIRTALVLLILCSLAGCGALDRINEAVKRGDDTAQNVEKQLDDLRTERPAPIHVMDAPWVSTTPIQPTASALDPALKCPIIFVPAGDVTLFEIGQAITRNCHIPVRITQDAIDALAGRYGNAVTAGAGGAGSGVAPLPPLTAPPVSGLIPPSVPRQTAVNLGRPSNISIKWTGGPLAGFLDTVASRFGLSWAYSNGAIRVYYLDTRVFHVYARDAKTTQKTTVVAGMQVQASNSSITSGSVGGATSGGAGGTTNSSGSMQTTEITSVDSITSDIESTIKAMHTPGTPPIAYARSTGTVTVTDTPDVLDRIETYLNAENKTITKQVLFFVQVLEVQLNNTDQIGIDWSAVYTSLNKNFGLSLSNNFAVDSSAMSASASVLNTATGNAAQFAGSKFIINALSSQGKVNTTTQPILRTLNLRTAPLQISKDTTYLASVSQSQTSNVGTLSALTPGLVTTGFNLNLSPTIIDNKRMLLDFNMNYSPDPKITTASSGDQEIQTPEVNRRLFQQSVNIKSGETMIISGFEQRTETTNKAGVGETYNWLFGGGGSTVGQRMAVAILVTPIIQD